MAVSADGRTWFLINASPDLRAQIEAFPALHPAAQPSRNSPIAGVLLTNADLDHVLGLYLLRERSSLRIHGPEAVFRVLANDLRLVEILKSFCCIEWRETPECAAAALRTAEDEPSGLSYRAWPLSTKPPPFAVPAAAREGTQSVAYEIVDERTHGRLVVAPDVASITPGLLLALSEADGVLFDGTFWSPDEFREVTGKARTASDMGHLIIQNGSLPVLAKLKARHKVYLHINNTNPVLNPRTVEYAEVVRAGLTVGHDGLELEL